MKQYEDSHKKGLILRTQLIKNQIKIRYPAILSRAYQSYKYKFLRKIAVCQFRNIKVLIEFIIKNWKNISVFLPQYKINICSIEDTNSYQIIKLFFAKISDLSREFHPNIFYFEAFLFNW